MKKEDVMAETDNKVQSNEHRRKYNHFEGTETTQVASD
jgi:hypothetical protein